MTIGSGLLVGVLAVALHAQLRTDESHDAVVG